jgi:transposase
VAVLTGPPDSGPPDLSPTCWTRLVRLQAAQRRGGSRMPRAYAAQFRSMVVEQVRSGRRVAEVAASVGVPEATVYRWVKQERIDRGEVAGTSSGENVELRAARRRIGELEAELATVTRASELSARSRSSTASNSQRTYEWEWRRPCVRASGSTDRRRATT